MVPIIHIPATVANVPFHSQLTEITSHAWQMQGCGITSLAMIIDYYNADKGVSVNSLLAQGIAAGAFINNVGWSYGGLIKVSKKYGLDGKTYDLSGSTMASAFAGIKKELLNGPVIASVHYQFKKNSPLPHLVVIDGIDGDTVYYNDPANKIAGEQKISATNFQLGWKKRMIVIRPVEEV